MKWKHTLLYIIVFHSISWCKTCFRVIQYIFCAAIKKTASLCEINNNKNKNNNNKKKKKKKNWFPAILVIVTHLLRLTELSLMKRASRLKTILLFQFSLAFALSVALTSPHHKKFANIYQSFDVRSICNIQKETN